jgi:DNA-binding Lrp family transcriptional regulator
VTAFIASGPSGTEVAAPNDLEKKLIYLLSGDLGRSPRPYGVLAQKMGLSEEETLAAVEELRRRGALRRLGAVVVHQRAGFTANAMVVWEVGDAGVDEAGMKLAALSYVTHCYRRRPAPGWPYDLYAMIHAVGPEALSAMVEEMSELVGVVNRRVLKSLEELKKTSMRHFDTDERDDFSSS